MPFPKPPEKVIPFRSGPVAPHDLERQFDEHRRALLNVIDFLRTIVRDDGVMRESAMPPPAARASGRAVVLGSSTQPPLPTGVLDPQQANFYATDEQSAGPLSSDYAQVAIAWAEHMPDTIPPNILAINAITGNHWSARWWANQAAQLVSSIGTVTGTGAQAAEAVTVTALNTCANLSHTPAGPVLLVVDGISFLPVGTTPPFVMAGAAIHWQSTIYSLIPGQTDVAAWYPY